VTDLLALTEQLCAVPSVSGEERALADLVETRLRERAPALEITRVGENVVARTQRSASTRIVLGGHLDTVPANGNATPRVDGDRLHGLGSADMNGGLAVLLVLAEALARGDGSRDVTLIFYEGEEVADEHNGLRHLFADRPDLVAGDLAVLLEPTGGWIEAGCQGTIHVRVTFEGARAHSARPWMGVSAGIANNVVPDRCEMVVNRRYAPACSHDDAIAATLVLLADADSAEVISESPAAAPNLTHPLVAELIATGNLDVRPKLGWTDVARFAEHGVPAVNFGPGDATVAHTADEHLDRSPLERVWAVLEQLLREGPVG
jgi:succinyl-diaminopimelate desuccinylase